MNPRPRVTGICACLFLLASIAWAAEAEPKNVKVADLTWLVGFWKLERNGRVVTERWDAGTGGMMMGTSQAVAKEKTVEYEFMIIREDAGGGLSYVAKPARQPEAAFKLVRAKERELLFENPEHDFPQRISYALQPDGSLLAAIEGTKDGKTRRIEYPYKPAK